MEQAGFFSRTRNSRLLFERALKSMPGGVSGSIKYRRPYPLFLSRASGSRVWDVDGNEYIDYVLSYGALILGHGHPRIRAALNMIMDSIGTILFGNPSKYEVEFAELLLGIMMRDGKVRFTNSGLEATLLAVRLAKAFTGKDKVAKFDAHYHGANPFLLANMRPRPGSGATRIPESVEFRGHLLDQLIVLPFNDVEATKEALDHEDDVAALILEPFEDGYIPADEDFMYFLRKYTEERGIVLIFDEVKTGFRVRLGGAVEYYGIKPDIICLGKVIGGGAPIGAVIGRQEIMDLLDPSSRGVFHSGTFNGNPLSMILGMETIRTLMSDDNFARLVRISGKLKEGIFNVFRELNIPVQIYGEGGIVNYVIGSRRVKSSREISPKALEVRRIIDSLMLTGGIYLNPGSRYSISLAHTDSDIEETINVLRNVLNNLRGLLDDLLKGIP